MEKKNLSTIITYFIYVYGMRMKGFLSALSYDKTLTWDLVRNNEKMG